MAKKYILIEAGIQPIANKLWNSYLNIFPKLRGNCPLIKINGRLTRTIGWNKSGENLVELSAHYLVKYYDRMVSQILIHELAHQIDYNLFGWNKRDPHHRKSWVNIMIRLGQEPNIYQEGMDL